MAVISNSTVGTLVSGTSSADTIYNTGANVTIQALGGNDSVVNHNDYIEDEDESYMADSLGSYAKISAGDGDDTIRNENAYLVSIDGGKGKDFIYNSGSTAMISGGDNNDTVQNDDAWGSTISGGKGNDSITSSSYDSIDGGDGNDDMSVIGVTIQQSSAAQATT